MASENPWVAKVLKEFPDVDPGSLKFPLDSADWAENDVRLFVASGGFVKPKKKKAPAAAQTATAAAPPAPAAAAAPPARGQGAPAATERAQAPAAAKAAPEGLVAPVGGGYPPDAGKPRPADGAGSVERATGAEARSERPGAGRGEGCPSEGQRAEEPRRDPPSFASLAQAPAVAPAVAEMPSTVWHQGAYWAPYTTYMEDVGERGLRLLAILNKCERFRNVGLMKGADFTLEVLKQRFGVGILLREFSFEIMAALPKDIMSSLWVSLRLELPCSPFMPMFQTIFAAGSGARLGQGAFGMVMLRNETMSVLEDRGVYEQVAVPLRKAFGIPKPTGRESNIKFHQAYPRRGRPFRPTHLLRTSYTVMPSDCDMYRVIFHPQMVAICEKVNYALGADFKEEPAAAIYANLKKPARVGDRFDVRIFLEAPSQGGAAAGQTRALYLFAAAAGGGSGGGGATNGPEAAAVTRCVMSAFVVFGPPPGELFAEDINACAATVLIQGRARSLIGMERLESFALGGPTPPPDKDVDLTSCERSGGGDGSHGSGPST